MKKVAIMQPYFMPYIGYFQLIKSVDEFVIYDNIKFTKKGWINRNRILVNGKDFVISLPLKNDSDFKNVVERRLADTWKDDRIKLLNRISESYKKAPFYDQAIECIKKSILFENLNLFDFIFFSIKSMMGYLGITTKVTISSNLSIDHDLKSEKKVIEICKVLKADQYINAIGGVDLYSKENFKNESIGLHFLKSNNIVYKQFNFEFVPSLSIIDLIMFNPKEELEKFIDSYILI